MLEPAASGGCELDKPETWTSSHSVTHASTACSDERHYGSIVQNNEAKKEDELIFIRV